MTAAPFNASEPAAVRLPRKPPVIRRLKSVEGELSFDQSSPGFGLVGVVLGRSKQTLDHAQRATSLGIYRPVFEERFIGRVEHGHDATRHRLSNAHPERLHPLSAVKIDVEIERAQKIGCVIRERQELPICAKPRLNFREDSRQAP